MFAIINRFLIYQSTIPYLKYQKIFKALIAITFYSLIKYCLSNCQYVFRSKHSVTISNLIFQLDIFNSISERNLLDCIYTTYKKSV